MLRTALAAASGFAVWTVLFLGLAAVVRLLFPEAHSADGAVFETLPLLVYLVLAAAASAGAGYTAARVAITDPKRAVLATAVLLLVVGLAVQITSWSLAPSWYNVAFIAVLVPLTILGGRLAGVPR